MTKNQKNIEEIIKEKKPIIDKLIEKYIPKRFNKENIKTICERPEYDFDIKACNNAIALPMWNLIERGGKRFRPVLFLLTIEALGKDPKRFQDFSIIPELIHEGTLIVDDVEDSSELRRGKPCIHKIFGEDIAINVGNAMYYLPLIVFKKNRKKIKIERLVKAYEIYVQEMINLSFGQAMDIAWHRGLSNRITERQYLQMCAYKTGALARMSVKLAAVLCGAEDKVVEKLGKFAESIGVGFQIQDDILDITAPKCIGKSFGNDIKEGKRTLMVIHTLRKANEKDKARLLEILNKHTDNIDERQEAIEIIKRYGSVDYAKQVAERIVKKSWEEVEKLLPETQAKEKLKAFADFLVHRKY